MKKTGIPTELIPLASWFFLSPSHSTPSESSDVALAGLTIPFYGQASAFIPDPFILSRVSADSAQFSSVNDHENEVIEADPIFCVVHIIV
jgi:hypothetical protein